MKESFRSLNEKDLCKFWDNITRHVIAATITDITGSNQSTDETVADDADNTLVRVSLSISFSALHQAWIVLWSYLV